MKLWICVVACSMGSSVALTWFGVDGAFECVSRSPSMPRASVREEVGTLNATAVDRLAVITNPMGDKRNSHHQGNT